MSTGIVCEYLCEIACFKKQILTVLLGVSGQNLTLLTIKTLAPEPL